MTHCEHLIENALMRMQRARLANMDTYEAFQDEMNWRGNRDMLEQVHMTKEELWEIAQYIMYVWDADDWADLLSSMQDLDEYKDTYLKVNGLDYSDYNTQIGDSCMANNLNGYVYEVSTDHLDNIHRGNHDKIDDAIKRIEKYVRK